MIIYNDAIHQLDKLDSFPATAFELVSSIARALRLSSRGCDFESHHQKLSYYVCSGQMKFILIHGEIKVEKRNMGHVKSRNGEKPTQVS